MPLLTVKVKGDKQLREKLARIREAGRAADATLIWAQAIAIQDRQRARAKGGRSFWRDQARRIQAKRIGTDGAGVWVGIEGLHHDQGGDIFPTRAEALTIPIAPEARGKRAAEFETGGRDLFVLPSFLTDVVGVLGYVEENGTFHALYSLRKKVHHDPKPWLVDEGEARRIGRAELSRFLEHMVGA